MKRIGCIPARRDPACTTLLLSQQAARLQPQSQGAAIRNIRQLTTGGENAEAYFSPDGKKIIFQSTREPYKCDQIFTMNADGMHTGLKLVSTGKGPHDMRLLHAGRQPHRLRLDASGIAGLPAQPGPRCGLRLAAIQNLRHFFGQARRHGHEATDHRERL